MADERQDSSQAFGTSGGYKNDKGKLRFDLVPPEAEEILAEVLMLNAKSEGGEYADRNWEEGMSYLRAYSAVRRHLNAWLKGEDVDPKSGNLHINHAFCMLAFLVTYTARDMIVFDDRPPSVTRPASSETIPPYIQEQLDREDAVSRQNSALVIPTFDEVCDNLDRITQITQAEHQAAMPDVLMEEVDSHAEGCHACKGQSIPMPYDGDNDTIMRAKAVLEHMNALEAEGIQFHSKLKESVEYEASKPMTIMNTQELRIDDEVVKARVAIADKCIAQDVRNIPTSDVQCHSCICKDATCPIQCQHNQQDEK